MIRNMFFIVCMFFFLVPASAQKHDNRCLIWALKTQSMLPTGTWSKILIVRWPVIAGHVWCIFYSKHRWWAADNISGSTEIYPKDGYASSILKALGLENTGATAYYLEDRIKDF